MRIVFFGTSEFAVPVLEALVRSGMRPVLTVTAPDAPVGRKQILSPPPIKIKALELELDIIQPKTLKDPEVLAKILAVKPEVGVLAAYGKIIPKALIDVFPKGILNVHPSLLPRWRGATPIQSAILAGDEKTGVTIILMDEEVDHGPVLAKRELPITNYQLPKADYETLYDKLSKLGAEMIAEVLPKWLSDELSPVPQDHSRATFCKKFTRGDAKIDWSRSAEEIDRMVRALNPEPGTWAEIRTQNSKLRTRDSEVKILKILAVQLFSNSRAMPAGRQELERRGVGEIFAYETKPVVKCGKSALILERVQPEGKKPMSGEAFLRGHRNLEGPTLLLRRG